jgi:hypothetical protein
VHSPCSKEKTVFKSSKKDFFYQSIYFYFFFNRETKKIKNLVDTKSLKETNSYFSQFFDFEQLEVEESFNFFPNTSKNLNLIEDSILKRSFPLRSEEEQPDIFLKPGLNQDNFKMREIIKKIRKKKLSEIWKEFNLYSKKNEFNFFKFQPYGNSNKNYSEQFFTSYKKSFLSYWIISFAALAVTFPNLLKTSAPFSANEKILSDYSFNQKDYTSNFRLQPSKSIQQKQFLSEILGKPTLEFFTIPFELKNLLENSWSIPRKQTSEKYNLFKIRSLFENISNQEIFNSKTLSKKYLESKNSFDLNINDKKNTVLTVPKNKIELFTFDTKILVPNSVLLNYYNLETLKKNQMSLKNVHYDLLLKKKQFKSTFNWYWFNYTFFNNFLFYIFFNNYLF